ncbi:MAG: AbrB family transcriptional regulator [Rubrobacteraceae bacterium]
MSVALLGAFGAFAGHKVRFPAGAFIGALIGVGLALGLHGFPNIPFPEAAGWGLQVLVGILVGLGMTRDSLRHGANALVPASLLSVVFLSSAALAALAAVRLTGISPTTALFAAAPGGLTEMAVVGATQGADGPAVAAIHLSRLLLVILIVGFLASRLETRSEAEPEETPREKAEGSSGAMKLAGISGAGVAGGALALALTPLPAGGVVGALLGAGLARVTVKGPVPQKHFRLAVMAIGGGLVGLGFSSEFFEALLRLAGAALLINAVQMSVWLLAYYLLVRAIGYDPQTSVFASAPGGMGSTLSMVGDTGADLVTVAFTHLLRLTATIIVVPFIVTAFVTT